jgi:hypothetical protein
MNMTDPDPCLPKAAWRVALEDAIVVGAFAGFSGLIATGAVFPPEPSVLYATGLSAGLAAIVAWARRRGVEVKN